MYLKHAPNYDVVSIRLLGLLLFCCIEWKFFRGSSKQDDGLELLGRAANLYKMAKKWDEAGQTFTRVAEVHYAAGNKHDASSNFVDASNCFKKNDPNRAAASLQVNTRRSLLLTSQC